MPERFEGVAAVLGEPTTDGRLLAADMDLQIDFEWPLPLTGSAVYGDFPLPVGIIRKAWVDDLHLHFEGEILENVAVVEGLFDISKPAITLDAVEFDIVETEGEPDLMVTKKGRLISIYLVESEKEVWPGETWIRWVS
jgi:hypothetical protein